jgi:hypothetical protein
MTETKNQKQEQGISKCTINVSFVEDIIRVGRELPRSWNGRRWVTEDVMELYTYKEKHKSDNKEKLERFLGRYR